MRRIFALAMVLLVFAAVPVAQAGPTLPTPTSWPPTSWPLSGDRVVLRGFEPPEQPWGAGNRGLDLAAAAGSSVHAVAAGTVTFTGQVGGQLVVVITHGPVRTTYVPVRAAVAVGERVSPGQRIGGLDGSHCPDQPCLHLGLIAGDTYLDPMELFATPGEVPGSDAPVRLLPEGVAQELRERLQSRTGRYGFVLPVAGPVTSEYGMRTHPVTGEYKLHDGTDFGAACGTPVVAPADGVVTAVEYDFALGLRVVIDHGIVAEASIVTALNHLSAQAVSVGQRVVTGQRVGAVGTTGHSTGCHLHLMVWQDGWLINPMDWF